MQRNFGTRVVICVLFSTALAGCAGRRAAARVPDLAPAAASDPAQPTGTESLSVFMAKMRALSAEARPRTSGAVAVESVDSTLRDALGAHAAQPSPATARAVAEAYARLGIFDRAYAFFMQALRMQPDDAATHDGLARLWRSSGHPHLALTDSYRAVFYAPGSPGARNTLGTILQALGQNAAARREYERALQLDPRASYALNNLCYGWLLEGDTVRAIAACQEAVRIQPGLQSAHNNLALAQAATGDLDAAQATLAATGDTADALFNIGMIHMARREYMNAVHAFMAAHTAKPSMTMAMTRARQAAAHLSAASEE